MYIFTIVIFIFSLYFFLFFNFEWGTTGKNHLKRRKKRGKNEQQNKIEKREKKWLSFSLSISRGQTYRLII